MDGSEEEAAFAKLFDKYVRRWHRAMEEERARAALVEGARQIHPRGGAYA